MNALLSLLFLPLKLFGLLFRAMTLLRLALFIGLLVVIWPYISEYIKPHMSVSAIKDFLGF